MPISRYKHVIGNTIIISCSQDNCIAANRSITTEICLSTISKMASKKGSNYFRYLFTLTSFLGLPLHPMNLKGASKIFYSIYGFVFVVFLPLAHATSQLAELPNVADDLKLITSILSFTFMDIIGKKVQAKAQLRSCFQD